MSHVTQYQGLARHHCFCQVAGSSATQYSPTVDRWPPDWPPYFTSRTVNFTNNGRHSSFTNDPRGPGPEPNLPPELLISQPTLASQGLPPPSSSPTRLLFRPLPYLRLGSVHRSAASLLSSSTSLLPFAHPTLVAPTNSTYYCPLLKKDY